MKPLVIANWKMNMTAVQAGQFLSRFKAPKGPEISIAAPYSYLKVLAKNAKGFSVAGQNVSTKESGALTGEVSAKMLKEAGVKYCLVGHSERRIYFKESNKDCNEKIKQLLAVGIIPVLCVGENSSERKSGKTRNVLKEQIVESLKGIKKPVIIAYEPVWAISSFQKSKKKVSASLEDVYKANAFIKAVVSSTKGLPPTQGFGRAGRMTALLYGGSVSPRNASELAMIPNVDGFLVGSASLEAKSFTAILKAYV